MIPAKIFAIALKNDGRNKVNYWFLRGQTSENIGQCKKYWSRLFILDKFHLKDNNGKL